MSGTLFDLAALKGAREIDPAAWREKSASRGMEVRRAASFQRARAALLAAFRVMLDTGPTPTMAAEARRIGDGAQAWQVMLTNLIGQGSATEPTNEKED